MDKRAHGVRSLRLRDKKAWIINPGFFYGTV